MKVAHGKLEDLFCNENDMVLTITTTPLLYAIDMKNTLRKNVIVAVTFLVLWMILDVIDVKICRIPSYKFELQIGLSIIFISFMIVNKNLMKTKKMVIRVIGIALISSIITSAWFVISVVILLQFHMSIGGHL